MDYYTPNRDKYYFNENKFDANCGSFAFNIVEWYCPDDSFLEDDLLLGSKLFDDGYCTEDINEILFSRNVEQILKDFDVEEVSGPDYPLAEDEELIAFRECVLDMSEESICSDEEGWSRSDYLSIDFHFRVKRDGIWQEKNGCSDIKQIDNYNEEPWEYNKDLIYDGPIAYFLRKLDDEELWCMKEE